MPTFSSLVLTNRDTPLMYPTNNMLPLLWQLKHVTGEFSLAKQKYIIIIYYTVQLQLSVVNKLCDFRDRLANHEQYYSRKSNKRALSMHVVTHSQKLLSRKIVFCKKQRNHRICVPGKYGELYGTHASHRLDQYYITNTMNILELLFLYPRLLLTHHNNRNITFYL